MRLGGLLARRGAKEAAWLTLALWAVSIGLWSMPQWLGARPAPSFLVVLCLWTVVLGLIFSWPLYLLIERANGWPRLPRVLAIASGSMAVALLHAAIDAGLIVWLRGTAPIFSEQLHREFASGTMAFVLIYGLYATALCLIIANLAVAEQQRMLAEAREAMQQAQIAALRFQLNPHFLFNTLNAISSLVVSRRNAEAERMIGKLSEFLRVSLEADPNGEVTLDEELATIQAYLDIEAVRFGDRLMLHVNCPPDLLDALVPSFVLQPLVENAVKYAVAPSRRPVTIRVRARREADALLLTVEDDGSPLAGGRPKGGMGLGLSNTRRRLAALYGEQGRLAASYQAQGFIVDLQMPLRHGMTLGQAA
ncbi:sensor histidine kinase [Acetobacteraceae bacterium H6797]|nr:sensor histidine kinase [Acetobacteraceae bacterium H6797]